MTEIMPVPRNLILLSYQQGAFSRRFYLIYLELKILKMSSNGSVSPAG